MKTKLLILVACFAAPFSLVAQSGKFALSGRVLDPNDIGIPGVRIQAYRNHGSIGNPVDSKRNGDYTIEFDPGLPLDTVRYDQSDSYPGTVENISGKNNHTVHKILYRRGQNLSAFEAEDVICAFERIAEIDAKNDTRQRSLKEYNYREALEEIGKLSLPPELRERIKQIKKKYGIQ